MQIQHVLKRNGELEKFDINKVLRWELWACDGYKAYVDWRDIIIKVKDQLYDKMTTQEIQLKLIDECNNRRTWIHSLIAGRLYAAYITKKIYPEVTPTLKELHTKLYSLSIMEKLNYTDDEYKFLDTIISHSKDHALSYGQINQLVNKYSLADRVNKVQYETPQFIYMRMAMALCEDESEDKIEKVKKFYKYLSENKLNAPTPNYMNLGTKHNGYISCCLYTTKDTAESLGVGDHIAYTMTYLSAGIGGYLNIRSIGDKVKGGVIKHTGKTPYFKAVGAVVNSTSQGGRGGSATQYFMCYDPEVIDIIYLQNPRTPLAKQNRDLHFAMQFNSFFVEKVHKNEDIFTFNTFTAPDLVDAFFSSDKKRFKEIYTKYENDSSFKKNYISAREIAINAVKQAHEVATLYFFNVDEANRHTPFKDKIYQSNLCAEVFQPTKPYSNIMDLYSTEPHENGEISLCALAGIVPSFIENDEEYEDVAYYALLMIDKCIHKNKYLFPHLEYTAKSRMNAGVGLIGIAHDLAKRGFNYTSQDGLKYIHFLAERHMYSLIKASLKLGKERGNAKWMHKTKWPEGWLPIDTYNKEIDTIADFEYKFDWEKLRQEVIDNGGLRNSVLSAQMPTESSSRVTSVPNGVYPVRDIYLKKTDANNAIDYVARDSDTLHDKYQLAWTLTPEEICKFYGVIQKFTDQGISADFYSNRKDNPELKASRLLDEFFYMYKYGLKSRYYTNSLTTKSLKLEDINDDKGCPGGFCTL